MQINDLCTSSAMWDDELLEISIRFLKAWITGEESEIVYALGAATYKNLMQQTTCKQNSDIFLKLLVKSRIASTKGENGIVGETVLILSSTSRRRINERVD